VALNKESDFFGKQALQQQKSEGAKIKLCCLTLDDPNTVVFGSEPIRHAGTVVGWVTSGGYGYSIDHSIAYSYLPIELAKPGTRLSVECFGVEIQAEVRREPLFDPKGEKIKA
jgi:4-methylaminobutanoate oxidase (formaldehyde-forming)